MPSMLWMMRNHRASQLLSSPPHCCTSPTVFHSGSIAT